MCGCPLTRWLDSWAHNQLYKVKEQCTPALFDQTPRQFADMPFFATVGKNERIIFDMLSSKKQNVQCNGWLA